MPEKEGPSQKQGCRCLGRSDCLDGAEDLNRCWDADPTLMRKAVAGSGIRQDRQSADGVSPWLLDMACGAWDLRGCFRPRLFEAHRRLQTVITFGMAVHRRDP